MTGGGRVLYVGQSGDLRTRLASYKNALPDRAARKTIRLINQVESITWEVCGSAAASRLRENQLLRLYRPKYNRANTYPQAYVFLWMRTDERGIELGRTKCPRGFEKVYGAFKTNAVPAQGALLRCMWAVTNQPASPYDYPVPLLRTKVPRCFRLNWPQIPTFLPTARLQRGLQQFLGGTNDELLELLPRWMPANEALGGFHRALQTHDLELLAEFYRLGPQRNLALSNGQLLPGQIIQQDELDDLLVLRKRVQLRSGIFG
jgi:hypothetical protein